MTSALMKQLLSLAFVENILALTYYLCVDAQLHNYITLYVKYNVFHTSDIWMPLAPPLISKGEAVCRPASTDTPLHL